jgi:hypothetical protein
MAEVFVFVEWNLLNCSLAPRNAVVSVAETTVVCKHVNIIIICTFICSVLYSGM